MQVDEKLGTFYLGKIVDPSTGKTENKPLLYESKDLTTHAVCVGMTGSGKTGLGITILEEAALDNIPAIIIDPKGDLADLLLTFPDLSPEEFKPWIDPSDAERKGMDSTAYASYISDTWKKGLQEWGEDTARIKKLRDAVDLTIYTPASNAGTPISILSSFKAPSKEELEDSAAIRERIMSVTSSLLGLLGIAADPVKSKEHILLSTIIQKAWENGENLDIANLIQSVQKPPFSKIGALDVDTFYPTKERMALSISLNNLLASPGFQQWMEGEPLDIQNLLYSSKGKPKLAIISIAHLSDSERMFFVTLLLNATLSWMRQQSGKTTLRALLYMDEIFGFFPPTATPPSKLPMLTLLKQARAFGVGIVLCTQNPVDLDYKGLANCGTWFIGKLQTERDKARVLEGLAAASNGDMNSSKLEKMLGLIGTRVFMMRSVHEKEPILFQTRWTLSYLRGPLTLKQISFLMDKPKNKADQKVETPLKESSFKQVLPSELLQFYLNSKDNEKSLYTPKLAGFAKLHFVDSKLKIDTWQDVTILAPLDRDGKEIAWSEGEELSNIKEELQQKAPSGISFAEVPSALLQEKNYANFLKALSLFLYQTKSLLIYQVTNPSMTSHPGESEGDFRARVAQEMQGKKDEMAKKIREKYHGKISVLNDKVARAQNKLEDKQQKAWTQKIQTAITFLTALFKAFFGRKVTKGTISEAGTALRRAGRMSQDSSDAERAEEDVSTQKRQIEELQGQMDGELSALSDNLQSNLALETMTIRPRKSDIAVDKIVLVWCPEEV